MQKTAILLILILSSLFTFAEDTLKDTTTHIEFPMEITAEANGKQISLIATGVATRSKFFIKIYSIAHYFQEPLPSKAVFFEEVFKPEKAKQFIIVWVRDVPSSNIQEAFRESFEKTIPREQYTKLHPDIETFLSFFNVNAKEKDQYTLLWIGDTLNVGINGQKKGELTNPELAAAIWGVWLGPKSVVNRSRLLSLVPTR